MDEDHAFGGGEIAGPRAADHAGGDLAGIDRVEQQTLALGEQAESLFGGRVELAVRGEKRLVVDFQIGRPGQARTLDQIGHHRHSPGHALALSVGVAAHAHRRHPDIVAAKGAKPGQ